MLTGTHLLQSCGIVLCEIETAEHQEQLFAINFNCFNTLNNPHPTPLPSHCYHPHHYCYRYPYSLFLSSCVSFSVFILLFHDSIFLPCFCPFLPSLSGSPLQPSLHCWYPSGLLSVLSRLDSWCSSLAFPPQISSYPLSSITLSNSDRHWGCQPVKEEN